MTIWIKEFSMQLLIWLWGFVDNVFDVFRAISGIETVQTPGIADGVTLTDYFLGLKGVQKAFVVVLIASVAICGVCTIVAVVKNTVGKNGEGKTVTRTVGQSVSTLFVSLLLACVMLGGVVAADGLLRGIDNAMNAGATRPMSHNIINISVGGGYEFDADNVQGLNETDEEGNVVYVSYLYEFKKKPDGSPERYGAEHGEYEGYIIYLDKKGIDYSPEKIYTPLLDKNGAPVLDDQGRQRYTPNLSELTPVRTDSGWRDKPDGSGTYSMTDLDNDIMSMTVKDLFGGTNKAMFVFPTSWKHDGMITPEHFNTFVAFLCTIVLLIALISATFGLVKRLFDLVLLFVTLPGIAATIPLDDGAKFKLWRETVISKVFLAFGTVLAVDVFTIVAPSLWEVSFVGGFTDTVLRVVLICGGALTIPGGQLLLARLLGTSAEESREMGQSARTLFGGAMTGIGAAKAAGRGLFGYRNANGKRVGGLIKGGAGLAGTLGGGVTNTVGGMIGGQAYRGSKFGHGVSKVQQALRGFGGSSGWFGEGTLGGSIYGGAGRLGSAIGGTRLGKTFNNGIVGAIKTPIDNRHAAARANARSMLAQNNAALGQAYEAAAASETAKLHALPTDYVGHSVMPGFESEPSNLPDIVSHVHNEGTLLNPQNPRAEVDDDGTY